MRGVQCGECDFFLTGREAWLSPGLEVSVSSVCGRVGEDERACCVCVWA